MGAVWLAERADRSLKRQVALKLPRASWSRGLAERMARERDILASLEHPNIARLYDAGTDAQGRPFLALEYVEGLPIDVYCRERSLGIRDRLQLLLQVAQAVAFAHSRLVVHRDLKPNNVLVTADGQVRLLDFGIAKLMEGDRTKETQLTQMSGRCMTLDYASPEQIRGEPIGTASDIYSLGVVAYELLTGARPYKLKRGSAAELEEAIATVDAPLASNTVDTGARRELRGDLDAILNKTLKKNPADRYATVDALAQDCRQYLAGHRVLARPDTLVYRVARLARRHRAPLIVGGVVALGFALALGVGATAVVIKGGHYPSDDIVDLLYEHGEFVEFRHTRVPSRHTHGTGCTFAAAITSHLALGRTLREAIPRAQRYIAEAIRHAPELGKGHGPMQHFVNVEK
jgi:serine/threonine-protein kinase